MPPKKASPAKKTTAGRPSGKRLSRGVEREYEESSFEHLLMIGLEQLEIRSLEERSGVIDLERLR